MGFEYIVNESYPMYCCDYVVGRFEGSENLAAFGNWQYFFNALTLWLGILFSKPCSQPLRNIFISLITTNGLSLSGGPAG